MTVRLKLVAPGAVPVASPDGVAWRILPRLAAAALPAGLGAGFTVEPDGTTDILTRAPGAFGLLRDTIPPAPPRAPAGRFSQGALILTWSRAADNSGTVAGYRITLDGSELLSVPGTARRASVRTFHPDGPSVYRIVALDAAGNASAASAPVTVVPAPRPDGIPERLPAWAWQVLAWQQHGRSGPRPAAPETLPAWYWRWAGWRLHPFRVER